jgi:hypothetical protein
MVYAKKIYIHAKSMREKKTSMLKSMNNPMLRSKKKRKKKYSPYFQIKGNHQRERES